MNGFVLIFADAIPSVAELAEALTGFDLVQPQPDHAQVLVRRGAHHLWIRPDYGDRDRGSIEDIREKWPPGTMPAYPRLVSLDTWDERLGMDVARQLAARCDFLVHTGRGEDYTAAAYAARHDAEPGWDWGDYPDGPIDRAIVQRNCPPGTP